ncbi:MAG: sulfatase-like hydrolase/transferase [Planctomycetales bacterium]|nr:sulfatase-like hydrolase/transferase [Planctomycetales bacterium]
MVTNSLWTRYLILGCILVSPLSAACPAADSRPNVVLMMVDDFGYECVGANGGESYPTPNLDRLASTGMRFEHCHVQPLCTPTRVQLMTGKYNLRNYLWFGILDREAKTFGHLFQDAGYATGICGKWQLGHEIDAPQHFGFQEAYLWQHTRRPPRYINPGLEHNGKEQDFDHGEYGPTLVNQFAKDFISKHRDQEFFLYYPMILTHDPFQPTPDSEDWDPSIKTEREARDVKHFGEMTTYMDKMVGEIDDHLRQLGIRDNTLLIIIGDNGTHPTVTSRFQGKEYQGGKGKTTNNGTHVPMIVSWPKLITAPRVSDALISSTDFLPTICEAAGIEVPQGIDGFSFYNHMLGNPTGPRKWLYTWYSRRQQLDLEVFEYVFDRQYKLYRNGDFFDLKDDFEQRNPLQLDALSESAKQAYAELLAALATFDGARDTSLDRRFIESRANSGSTSRE